MKPFFVGLCIGALLAVSGFVVGWEVVGGFVAGAVIAGLGFCAGLIWMNPFR